ncbi:MULTISPECIES: hypothetical protein [unclassified Polaribacter]|uniref:hypothetical protein n=1 Tax=unclassified Polaribacter TaxID=196858 RepID=UPI0011BFCC4C|nr:MULTISPECIES: hypothetical protein [unclassified Polaribacter]TXD53601.1 hypothetical protein ES043_02960 [Polaribacter sp. IC063]TXD62158.1 hypothetical protein ES044_02745 [Polaribacter sp. IC066]
MKNIKIITLCLCVLFSFKSQAQKNNGIVAAVAGIAAVGTAIAINSQMKEMAELKATEWILGEYSEFTSFSLKTLDFDAKKKKDASAVSIVTYKVQLFKPADKVELNGKKYVLFAFLSDGWINQNGIDFNRFIWHLVDESEWINMMTSYVKVSSDEKNIGTIQKTLKEGKIVNKGVRVKSKLVLPFYKLEGDMYVVTDYSDMMKIIYNEKSLGIYLKKTRNLVQIGRDDIIEIHDFLVD